MNVFTMTKKFGFKFALLWCLGLAREGRDYYTCCDDDFYVFVRNGQVIDGGHYD